MVTLMEAGSVAMLARPRARIAKGRDERDCVEYIATYTEFTVGSGVDPDTIHNLNYSTRLRMREGAIYSGSVPQIEVVIKIQSKSFCKF